MKNSKEPLVIYWAPAAYESDLDSWSLLYPAPVSLSSEVNSLRSPEKLGGDNLYACPAHRDTTNNIFVFKNAVENIINFPEGFLKAAAEEMSKSPNYVTNSIPFGSELQSRVYLNVLRKSSFDGYANVLYNMAWLFVAEDPVIAKFTPPYYPHSAPADGAMLSIGQFDIGQWFRSFQLDYHIPLSTDKLSFYEEDPLFYMQVLTDRPVVFKRFMRTTKIANLHLELGAASVRYGLFRPLTEKYAMAKNAKVKEQLMHEIKQNLVE
jgi:hypothetical protein